MLHSLAALCLLSIVAAAQPRLAGVEVYGLRKVSREKVLKLVGASAGDPLPRSKGEIEEKLEDLDGILRARLEAFCCEEGKPLLYVGIEERGAPIFQYRPWPEKEIELPGEVTSAWNDFTSALTLASAGGDVGEDLSGGHSLMENLPVRVVQERFLGLAELHYDLLRDVLANAFDARQRSIAAYVLGYSAAKKEVVNDLQSALQDSDPAVRANAARALKAIAAYSPEDPEKRPLVRPTWFVEMLNSAELQDRVEGSRALALFTEKPDENLFAHIRERALTSLLEIAAWRHMPHALPAFLVAGRLAGWTEEDLVSAWTGGNREAALRIITKSLTTKAQKR
jgi:hypothetical protein